MSQNMVISIGRQYGSGGREIGKILAGEFRIPFYDREIVTLAAQDSHMSEGVLEGAEEKVPNAWGLSLFAAYEMPMSDKIFLSQCNVIKRLADRGPCVIMGRCADYVLRNITDLVSVFIFADMDFRKERAKTMLYETPADKLEEELIKVDKNRAKYYNYYTDRDWGEASTYDLCINNAKIGAENSARLIMEFIKLRKD